MSDIDALIQELYPPAAAPSPAAGDGAVVGAPPPRTTPKCRSSFDSDPLPSVPLNTTDNNAPVVGGAGGAAVGPTEAKRKTPSANQFDSDDEQQAAAKPAKSPATANSFDDSDDEPHGSSSSSSRRGRGPNLPFPALPSASLCRLALTCGRLQCTLVGVIKGLLPPFHAHYSGTPVARSSFLDAGVDCSGGCACLYIQCLHCDHLVVRKQGVVWNDDQGSKDLYLDMRYHYPDWSAFPTTVLAPCSEVGTTAAAYCCQCSWFSVYGAGSCIVDAPLLLAPHGSRITSNRQSLSSGKTYPRWVCKGHPL